MQAGARRVIAVEASGMADYCKLLKDANPGNPPTIKSLTSFPDCFVVSWHLAFPKP